MKDGLRQELQQALTDFFGEIDNLAESGDLEAFVNYMGVDFESLDDDDLEDAENIFQMTCNLFGAGLEEDIIFIHCEQKGDEAIYIYRIEPDDPEDIWLLAVRFDKENGEWRANSDYSCNSIPKMDDISDEDLIAEEIASDEDFQL